MMRGRGGGWTGRRGAEEEEEEEGGGMKRWQGREWAASVICIAGGRNPLVAKSLFEDGCS